MEAGRDYVLHGRVRERAAVDALLRRARAGCGGCLVLHGEPGIGKTTLLGYAAEQATQMRVLHTAGVEQEAELGYAALHRLLVPVLSRIGQLPEPQASGLGVVFGQASGPTPDRFLVASATLSLLSEFAGERPILCLVDDAHWADEASLDAFAFVARRLATEPIALVVAERADEGWPLDVTDLVDLPLAGLDREAARALLVGQSDRRLSAAGQDELLRATAGNPLAIRELATTAPSGAVSPEPVPLTAGLQRAFMERVRQRDTAVQRVLLLVAANGSGCVDTIWRAAASLGVAAEPLISGALDDPIHADWPRVAFRHPLIRSAIYHGASPAERRAVHRGLAAAQEGVPAAADRRAWHLGNAAEGPDEQVAEELDRSAERALRRAGPAAAAFGRAAALSVSDTRQARRLVAAADAWLQGGDVARAAGLLDQAERADPRAETVRLDIAGLRGSIQLRTGDPSDVLALLLPVIPDVIRSHRHRGCRLLMLVDDASLHANAANSYDKIAALAERLPPLGNDADDALAHMFRAACRMRGGGDPGLEPGDQEAVERLTDPAKLAWAGGLAGRLGRPGPRRRLVVKAVQRARMLGAAGVLACALEHLVADELGRSRFRTAEAYAEEGHRLAVETGQPNMACRHRASLALLAALRGQTMHARQLDEEVLAESSTRGLAGAGTTARRALGVLDLAARRPVEAMDHLQVGAYSGGAGNPEVIVGSVPDLVEAAVRANQTDRVAEPLNLFTRWADATTSPELRALAARCRALLASGAVAEDEFAQALQLHAQAGQPLEEARTRLLVGEQLRRQRRRHEARPHLRAALKTFLRLGATVWGDRARDELRATGVTPRRPEPSTLTQLTPQELRIAAAVSEGATNREVAAHLFLSPRTVDHHLRNVFQKTNISSRAELVRLTLTTNGHGSDSHQ